VANRTPAETEEQVIEARRRLESDPGAQIGAEAIARELERTGIAPPPLRTIERILARSAVGSRRPAAASEDQAPVPFRRPLTTHEAVLRELRRAILEGNLRPGTQVLQDAIAVELGVSRVPVREALKILEGEGQVSYSPHRGYFVAELDHDELVEVYRIRELLENEAVSVGVPGIADEALAVMEAAMLEMEGADPIPDFLALSAANRRFHFALFESCRRPRLTKMIKQLWDATNPYRSVYLGDEQHRRLVDQEHREMFEAACRRDADEVIRIMGDHRHNAIVALRTLRVGD
jgi:DNA-binding GntR family transcriptional regulator